jgi:hypothetical protein
MHTKSTYLWQCHVSWRTLQRVPRSCTWNEVADIRTELTLWSR